MIAFINWVLQGILGGFIGVHAMLLVFWGLAGFVPTREWYDDVNAEVFLWSIILSCVTYSVMYGAQ